MNDFEFNSFSVSNTIVSVSENGAYPTPKDVSLDDGAPSLLNTSTRSPEPCPILHSTTASDATSKFIIVSSRNSFAASIATLSSGSLTPSYSDTPLPVRSMSIGFNISPPPNFGLDSPAVICTSSVPPPLLEKELT